MSLLSFLGVSDAYAALPAGGAHGAAGGIMSLLPMLVIFVVVAYFLIVRPQSKRTKQQRQLMEGLGIGDEVITAGGIVGRISKMQDNFVLLNLCNNVDITMQKNSIANTLPKGTLESMDK
ncbi:MAG: preprotein translocase subunit YajC [Gammaproteobacteria bacterium]|nr:preprotein translocase subunit YajC [Gammaproteobacteria bacterium]MCH9744165.1 preprotein translocase subunit YajC [Gammaproteobacteria bacterium]